MDNFRQHVWHVLYQGILLLCSGPLVMVVQNFCKDFNIRLEQHHFYARSDIDLINFHKISSMTGLLTYKSVVGYLGIALGRVYIHRL